MQNLLRRFLFHYWYFGQPPWDTGVSPPELLDFIQNHKPGRAIDIGCGTGTNVITLANAGWNVTGESDMHAISRAASMALWAYMGIESAAVSAGVIENPKRNIPLATLIGLSLAAVVYMLSSTVIMGILPNEELRNSHAPFAEAARLALGTPGVIIISVCAVLKSLGSLGGWMLLVGQSAKAAADDGMFPRAFARLNSKGVPGRGLVIVAILMTAVLFATMSPTLAASSTAWSISLSSSSSCLTSTRRSRS